MDDIICQQCGTRNEPGTQFCVECQSYLSWAETRETSLAALQAQAQPVVAEPEPAVPEPQPTPRPPTPDPVPVVVADPAPVPPHSYPTEIPKPGEQHEP